MAQVAPTGLINPNFYRATNRAPLTGLGLVGQSAKLVDSICIDRRVFRCVFSTQEFFKRRTESIKNKRSTINMVHNKLVYQMFAVVKRETPFPKKYQNAA